MKGIIHFHSDFSYDCLMSVDQIIDFAISNGLDFVILSDHDTFEGAKALRERVAERGVELLVPLAAEYHTEYGDIIAAFIQNEIKARRFDDFVEQVKQQDGVLLFPHPFQEHPKDRIETIAAQMDLIEVYNQRCTYEDDKRAKDLAVKFQKNTYPGSDAHLSSELRNVIVEVDCAPQLESLKSVLVGVGATELLSTKTKRRKVAASQIIKAIKQRRPAVLVRNLIGLTKAALKLNLNASCG
jgi:predicted metal-dependent phosphoesterase TrpH